MDIKRNGHLEAIVDEALANKEPSGSADEESVTSEFRQVASALRIQVYNAPAGAISSAKAILPHGQARPLAARLVYCSLQPQAVRSARAESFQMVFESELGRMRLMYSPVQSGWEVLGQIEGSSPSITRRGKPISCDPDGRFAYRASSLAQTGVILESGEQRVWVPSAKEAAGGGHHEPS